MSSLITSRQVDVVRNFIRGADFDTSGIGEQGNFGASDEWFGLMKNRACPVDQPRKPWLFVSGGCLRLEPGVRLSEHLDVGTANALQRPLARDEVLNCRYMRANI